MPNTPTPEPPSQQPRPPQQQPEATPASAWRSPRQEGQLITLPSGNVARVRRTLDLLTLVRSGRIPNPLRKVFEDSIRAAGDTSKFNPDSLEGKAMEQLSELLDAILLKCVIEPPVQAPPEPPERPEEASDEEHEEWLREMEAWERWEPEPGHISTNDVDLQDKMFIFAVAQGGAASLSQFRQLQAEHVASVQDGQGVQHDPQQPAVTG